MYAYMQGHHHEKIYLPKPFYLSYGSILEESGIYKYFKDYDSKLRSTLSATSRYYY